MKEQSKELTSFLLIVIHLVSSISIYFYENKLIGLFTLLIEFASCIILFFLNNRHIVNTTPIVVVLILNIFSLCATMLFHTGFGVVGIYFNMILAILIFGNISISKDLYRQLHLLTAILISLFIFTSKITIHYETILFEGTFGDDINANMLGVWALASFYHWMCFLSTAKISKTIKILCRIIVSIVAVYYINISDCRSALFAIILFFILIVFKKKPLKNKSFNLVVKILLIGSLLFTILYVRLAENYGDIEVFGKDLFSGRQYVWESAFKQIKKYPIFGSGTDFSMIANGQGETTQSTHNTVLGLLRTLGIIPTVTFLIYAGKTHDFKEKTKVDKYAQFAFISCLLVAFFEQILTERFTYMLFLSFLLFNIKQDERRSMLR